MLALPQWASLRFKPLPYCYTIITHSHHFISKFACKVIFQLKTVSIVSSTHQTPSKKY